MNPSTSSSSETANDVALYPSPGRLILLTLGGLLFVLLGLWIGIHKETPSVPWEVLAASYVGVPFFGACFLYTAYRLIVRKPALILNREGIIDQSSAFSAGLVRWEEIDRIFIGTIQRQRFVSIAVKSPDHFLSRVTGLKAKAMRMNVGIVGAPVNIPLTMLPMNEVQILQAIQDFRSKHRV